MSSKRLQRSDGTAVTLMPGRHHDLAATLSETAGEAASKTGDEVAACLKRACRRGVIQDCSVKDWRSLRNRERD